jgi:peptidoglycan lytic transglycosylase G
MTTRRKIFAAIFFIFIVAIATTAIFVWSQLNQPYRKFSEDKLAVAIPPGTSLDSASRLLATKGVVKHPWLLKSLFYYNRTQGKMKAGEYVFDRAMTPYQVYEKLLRGEQQYLVLTIPEGTNTFDLPGILAKEGIKPEDVQAAMKSPSTLAELQSIDPGIHSCEGFLFPETYFLTKTDDAQKILLVMIGQFKKKFLPQIQTRAKELGMSVVNIVTLASLIEKETGQGSERRLISGVFHNRLKHSMLLQCDPTVIYALRLNNEYKGFITRADLQKPSPYNTYVSAGLPPGPICNPGAAAIMAAMNPETTDKLYFVSKNDGTHYFSATLQEHNRAVQQYQRN